MQVRIEDRFAGHGVDKERIGFRPHIDDQSKYLNAYNEIDIALDPLPYNGGTTTCDTLWMGVPVVTQLGQRASSRAGARILMVIGLPELVGTSEEEYVDIATKLANDSLRLKDYRASLRQKILASPICDYASFTRNMEKALVHCIHEGSGDTFKV